ARSKAKSRRAPRRRSSGQPARRPAAKVTAQAGVHTSPSTLPPIDCVVVLMQENRSLDHLFGKWPGVAGLSQGPFSNRPDAAAPAGAGNAAISAGQPALFTVNQGQGPGHSLNDTNVQLFTTKAVPSGAALKPVNDRGFVQNYKSALATDGFSGPAVDL